MVFEAVDAIAELSIRKESKRHGVDFSFLFMRADGKQLGVITKLIDAGIIKPVVDKVLPFESINEALAYVKKGRAKGKVVVKLSANVTE